MNSHRAGSSTRTMTTMRRDWLRAGAIACLWATAMPSRWLHAAPPALPSVRVHDTAMAALIASIGGAHSKIEIMRDVAPTTVVIDGQTVDLAKDVMLKGGGGARDRFLDDPRNALKLARVLRDRLAATRPELKPKLVAGHAAWTKSFVKRVFAWQHTLERSPVHGAKIRDRHERIYLLEWAGATIDPKATVDAPATLAQAPAAPTSGTPAAYEAYIDALVRALI